MPSRIIQRVAHRIHVQIVQVYQAIYVEPYPVTNGQTRYVRVGMANRGWCHIQLCQNKRDSSQIRTCLIVRDRHTEWPLLSNLTAVLSFLSPEIWWPQNHMSLSTLNGSLPSKPGYMRPAKRRWLRLAPGSEAEGMRIFCRHQYLKFSNIFLAPDGSTVIFICLVLCYSWNHNTAQFHHIHFTRILTGISSHVVLSKTMTPESRIHEQVDSVASP